MQAILSSITPIGAGELINVIHGYQNIHDTFRPQAPPINAEKKNWSVWTYIPEIISGTLATAQTVAGIAHILLGNQSSAIICFLGALSSAYATWCIHQYRPILELQHAVQELAQTTPEILEETKQLMATSEKVKTVEAEFRQQLTERDAALQEKTRALNSATEKLQTTAAELEEALHTTGNLETLLRQLTDISGQISSKTQQFHEQQASLVHNTSSLKEVVAELDVLHKSLHFSDDITDSAKESLRAAQGVLASLQSEFNFFSHLLLEISEEKEKAFETIKELQQQTNTLKRQTSEMENINRRIDTDKENIRNVIELEKKLLKKYQDRNSTQT